MLKELDHTVTEEEKTKRKEEGGENGSDLGTLIQTHSHKLPHTLCSQLWIQDIAQPS